MPNLKSTLHAKRGAAVESVCLNYNCFFRRMLIKVNGATVEDISNLGRLESQIAMFVSTNKKRNWGDAAIGWATLTDSGIDDLPKILGATSSVRVT